MQHPDLLAALAEDRRRQCPCGAMAEEAFGLCRKCHARFAWRRKTASRRHQAARKRVGRRVRRVARLLTGTTSLLSITTKGMGE
jgi:hypothetical protein